MTGVSSSDPLDVPISDESIKLGQFLKLANLIESGSEAKPLLAAGMVRVNGEVETRRGRQLQEGDVVTVAAHSARVSKGTAAADDLPW
jgi:ribosome-associated protein